MTLMKGVYDKIRINAGYCSNYVASKESVNGTETRLSKKHENTYLLQLSSLHKLTLMHQVPC
jgi:hypothetical protein